MKRCGWSDGDKLMLEYHDKEWGRPVHNDQKLFEMLTLEGAQAGLSWSTVLNRRANYKKAFVNFNIVKVSTYTNANVKRLLSDSGIIRNKLKINSVINNAKRIVEVKKEFGTFDKYVWSFVKNKTITNNFKKLSDLPYSTPISEAMSKDLKKRGFAFVGPSVCYSFMQAVGMVNDHMVDCFRHKGN